jgi:hypothetical protein
MENKNTKNKVLILGIIAISAVSAAAFSSLTINNSRKVLASRESATQAHTFQITNFLSGTPWSGGYTYYAHQYYSSFNTALGNTLSFNYSTDIGGGIPNKAALTIPEDDFSFGIKAECKNEELTNCFKQITAITVTFTGKIKLGISAYTLNQERTAATFNNYYFNSTDVRAELTSDIKFSLDGLEQYNKEGLMPNCFRLYTPSSATITKLVIEYIC